MLGLIRRERRWKPEKRPAPADPVRQARLKFRILQGAIILAFLVLSVQLWKLQIVLGDYYRTLADNNRLRVVPVPAPRGVIYDARGNLLVRNIPSFSVTVVPADLPRDRQAEVAGRLAKILNQPAAEFAPVKRFPAAVGDFPEGSGQVRLAENLARLGRVAVGQEGSGRGREAAKPAGVGGDGRRQPGCDGKALLGQGDGRLEDFGEGPGAVALPDGQPAVDDARHGDGQGAGVRDAVGEPVRGCGRRGRAAGVNGLDPAVFGPVNQGEEVAADVTALGFDHGEDGRRRQRRIESVAALAEHLVAGLGGQVVVCGDKAVPGHNRPAVGSLQVHHGAATPGKIWAFGPARF